MFRAKTVLEYFNYSKCVQSPLNQQEEHHLQQTNRNREYFLFAVRGGVSTLLNVPCARAVCYVVVET